MNHISRHFAAALLAGTAAATLSAQNLELEVAGGSTPGSMSFDLHPGLFAFEFGAILPSFGPGPTPLSLFDPNDARVLNIGSELLSAAWFGFMGLDGHLRIGPLALASVPALQDQTIFFQAITLGGLTTLVDRISNSNVIRLGIAGTFRDRNGSFQDDRAFATVLPRSDRTWMVIAGGRGGLLSQTAHRTTSIYDPITDTTSVGPQLTTPRSMHCQTQLADGRWLVTGGVNVTNDPQALCEVYDPALDTFTAVAPMLVPRMGHTATLLANGRVLVTGGLQAMTVVPTALSAVHDATATAEIYDPIANNWTASTSLRTPRCGHVAITRPDGRILFAGGISWDTVPIFGWLPTVRSTTDLYDPIANTMVAGPSMASARSMLDPVPLGNDRWLLAGGISSLSLTNLGTPTATAEIYNAVANTWTTVGSMATSRGMCKGWALDGTRFLLCGGANGTILSPNPLASSEIFSTATNTFTAGPPMNIPRAGLAVFLTPQGQIHVFGGGTTNNAISNTTEWYYF